MPHSNIGDLRDGDTPAVALWRAKLRVRRSHLRVYDHPRKWAGFVLLGEAPPPRRTALDVIND